MSGRIWSLQPIPGSRNLRQGTEPVFPDIQCGARDHHPGYHRCARGGIGRCAVPDVEGNPYTDRGRIEEDRIKLTRISHKLIMQFGRHSILAHSRAIALRGIPIRIGINPLKYCIRRIHPSYNFVNEV